MTDMGRMGRVEGWLALVAGELRVREATVRTERDWKEEGPLLREDFSFRAANSHLKKLEALLLVRDTLPLRNSWLSLLL